MATDAGLPDRLTVPYILGLQEVKETITSGDQNDSSTKIPGNRENLIAKLQSNGVAVTSEDSVEQLQQVCRVLLSTHSKSSFWPKHYALHPKQSRVKNWLWVHERYRVQAKALLNNIPDDTPPSQSNAQKLQKEFNKFHGKMESHSEFEDNQLFKYFIDSKIGNQDSFNELVGQHSDLRESTELKQTLEGLLSSSDAETNNQIWKDKVKLQLQNYIQELNDHLQLEEQTVVGPWLQLSDEEYKKYRSYLSWKYCFMY